MTKYFPGLPILVNYFLLVAISKAQDGENLAHVEIEPPAFPTTYLMNDDDSDGEICDPSTQNACDSPQAECIWSPRDMMYRCSSQHDRGNRQVFLRKRQARRRKLADPPTTSESTVTVATSTQNSVLVIPKRFAEIPRTLKEELISKQKQKWESSYDRAVGEMERRAARAKNPSNATREVPKYEGLLTWDGKTEYSETCILKSAMADALQDAKSMDSKEKWIADNKENVCDFTKFFHCIIEVVDTELQINPGEEYDPADSTPVCRCYESAMPVVNEVCYIPADFGTKSACGPDVTAPYPIQHWKNAAILRPKCTPNSECKESQYWFGKRCTCRFNVKWNSQTHTCDNGIKMTISVILISMSLLLSFFSRLFTSYSQSD